jgi:hypothetical protein
MLLPVIGLIGFLLPFLGKYLVNKVLKRAGHFTGSIRRFSVSPFGGGFAFGGFYMLTTAAGLDSPLRFMKAGGIKLNINRLKLWKGILDIEIFIDSPTIIFSGESAVWHQKLEDAMAISSLRMEVPVVVSRMEITNCELEYIDSKAQPLVDLVLSNLQVTARNLVTSTVESTELPSQIDISGKLYNGSFNANIKANLSGTTPAFDVNAELKNLDLTRLNSFFKAYGNFDVNKGTISIFAEAAAKNTAFKGYVKPEVFDLDVLGPEDRYKSFLNRVWQGVLGAGATIFRNPAEKELATKVPFSGTFKAPHTNIFYAATEVLVNAFVKALKPSIDYDIDIHSVGGK